MTDAQSHPARRFPRVNVGHECSIDFVAADNLYETLQVKDIGLGGCGILVPTIATQPLVKDVLVEKLIVSHPKLPRQSLKGRVAFILGKHNPDPDAFSIMGIEFLDVPSDFRLAMEVLISGW